MTQTGTIVLNLGSNITYVAGTVNDISKVFIQDDYNLSLWRATVDVSNDNVYRIDLELYDAAGNSGKYNTTIYYVLPSFIYDRTQADVDLVKDLNKKMQNNTATESEKQKWHSNLKGALNTSDLFRIENDIQIISDLLGISLVSKRDNLPELPTHDYYVQLINNVTSIRNSKYIYTTTPPVPECPINSYKQINDIEKILYDVYTVFNSNFYHYAGESVYAGENIGLLL